MAGLGGVFRLTAAANDVFRGDPAAEGGSRVYGGHTLAQALLAAFATLEPKWACHTFHAQFLRPASPDDPISHAVERTSDGRNFSVRRIVARQSGKVVLTATGSFQTPDQGAEHQSGAAPTVPFPDQLVPESERYGVLYDSLVAEGASPQQLPTGIDCRLTDPQDYRNPVKKPSRHPMWLRATEAVPAGDQPQQVALAYCSDYNFNEPVLRPHSYSWIRPTPLGVVTLDHSIWFHRPSDMTRWHLCDAHAVSTGSGRGHVTGRLYNSEQALVASFAQEARLPLAI